MDGIGGEKRLPRKCLLAKIATTNKMSMNESLGIFSSATDVQTLSLSVNYI